MRISRSVAVTVVFMLALAMFVTPSARAASSIQDPPVPAVSLLGLSPGGFVNFTGTLITPVGEAPSDVQVALELGGSSTFYSTPPIAPAEGTTLPFTIEIPINSIMRNCVGGSLSYVYYNTVDRLDGGTGTVACSADSPPITINGVTANITLTVGEQATIRSDGRATYSRFDNESCGGAPSSSGPNGFSIQPTIPTTFSVLAAWIALPDLQSVCLIATWIDPAPAVPPSLTLNGVAANATLTLGDAAFLLTDPAATISLFQNADCSGPAWLTRPGNTSIVPTIAGTTSFQAWWNDFPDLKSACLVGTWLDPAPLGPPPLTINGLAANASLTVGDIATIETDSAASLLIYSEADCGGTPFTLVGDFATSETVVPLTISYRAFWNDVPAVQSGCLNAVWTAPAPSPTSTSTPSPTAIPSETATATETATVTISPTVGTGGDPTTAPTGEPTIPATTEPPGVPPTSLPVPTGPAVVTSLPSTGSEPVSSMIALVATASALIIVVGAAGAYRFMHRNGES